MQLLAKGAGCGQSSRNVITDHTALAVGIGVLLSLACQLCWQGSRRIFACAGAIACISAYCVALLMDAGIGATISVFASLALATGSAFGLWFISRRARSSAFLLIALATSEIVRRAVFLLEGLTNGTNGLRVATTPSPYRGLITLVAAICVALCLQFWWRSRSGLAATVNGESPLAGKILGIREWRISAITWALAGLCSGSAGVAYALTQGYTHPDDFPLSLSIGAIAVGLVSRPRNAALDVLIISAVFFGSRELLRWLGSSPERFAWHELLLGASLAAAALWTARKNLAVAV